MTERVRRPAVWMLTWLVATASATAMAWWAVTFVTVEVGDRRPLRPSDVVAASILPVVPVPTWADGSPVVWPPAGGQTALDVPDGPAGMASPASRTDEGGGAPPQTISTPVADAYRSNVASPARLIARWSATPNASQGPTPTVSAATSDVTVALSPQATPVAAPAPGTGVTASLQPAANLDAAAASPPTAAPSTSSPSSSQWPSKADLVMAAVTPAPNPRPATDRGHQPADFTASATHSGPRRAVARTHDASWLWAQRPVSASPAATAAPDPVTAQG